MATELDQDVLNQLTTAKAAVSTPKIKHGAYVLDVEVFKYKKTEYGNTFFFEWRVVEAAQTGSEAPSPVGTVVSEGFRVMQKGALNRLKTAVANHLGKNPETWSGEEFTATVNKLRSDANPLRGKRVRCTTSPYKVQGGPQAGREMVRTHFEYVQQTKEQIQARRKELDASAPAPAPAAAPAAPPPAPKPPPAPVAAADDDDLPF